MNFFIKTRAGRGKYTYANITNPDITDRYEGDWKNNLKDGIGRYFYADKSEYYGTLLRH